MSQSNGPTSNLRDIFLAARAIADDMERNAYLEVACGDNTPMRRRVLRMISVEEDPPTLLSSALDNLKPLTSQLTDEVDWKQWLDWQTADEEKADAETENAEASKPSTRPNEQFGPYEVIRKLGVGGMGTVYLAQQHTPIKRQVALKIINPGMDSRQVLARFKLEQQALARMHHPNITNVLDAGLTTRGTPYLVMEWVDGQRIDQFFCDHKVALEGRLRIFVDICQAVHHAHQRGIIHRDLKPSNVMITRVDGRTIPKVIDFGVAKALDSSPVDDTRLTDYAQLIGTPDFMSPEQAAWGSQEIDTRSDVYSLGALLYMLVTGVPPLDRDTLRNAGPVQLQQYLQEVLPLRPSHRISDDLRGETVRTESRQCPVPDASQTLGRVRSELDWIVMKALEKQPQRRYDSAGLLADDIERFLQGKSVQARPPSVAYRLSRSAKRYRVALGFATALLLTALVGGGMAVYNGLQAIDALEKSRENEARNLRLLEASQLQQMLEQFAKNNISPPQQDLPREADGPFLRATDRPVRKAKVASGSLRQLLSQATHPRPKLTFQHPGPVYETAVEEESRRMAVCCGDGCVYVWDLAQNKLLHRFGKHFGITTATFSPAGDTLLTGDQDGSLRVWNLQSGLLVREEPPALKGVAAIVWSPNKSCFAVGFRHGDISVRAPDYAELFRIERGANRAENSSLLYSQDGLTLYAPAGKAGIQVWDTVEQKRLKYLNPITPESQEIVMRDNQIPRLSMIQDQMLERYKLEFMSPRSICWANEDRRWILVSRFHAGLLGVDTHSDAGWSLPCDLPGPTAISISPSSKHLVMASAHGTISVRTLTINEHGMVLAMDEVFRFQAHELLETRGNYPTIAAFLKSGELVTGGEDGKVHFWDLAKITPQQVITDQCIPFVEAVSRDEVLCLVPGSEQPIAQLVRRSIAADGERRVLAEIPFPSWTNLQEIGVAWIFPWIAVKPFVVHPHQPVVAISNLHTVELRSALDGSLLSSIASEGAWSVSFAQDVNQLLVGHRDNWAYELFQLSDDFRSVSRIGQWQASLAPTLLLGNGQTVIQEADIQVSDMRIVERSTLDGKILKHWPGKHRCFAISEDESLIALHSEGLIEVEERRTRRNVFRGLVTTEIKQMQFCDDSQILLTLHSDNQLRAWHLPTGSSLGSFLSPSKSGYLAMGMFFMRDNPSQLTICYKAGDRSDTIELLTLGTPLQSRPTHEFSTGWAALADKDLAKFRFEN